MYVDVLILIALPLLTPNRIDFASSEEPRASCVSYRWCMFLPFQLLQRWLKNRMHLAFVWKKELSKPGSRPFSDGFIESIKAPNCMYFIHGLARNSYWLGSVSRGIHADGWSLFGGNQFSKPKRLAKLGWKPVETKKLSILDTMKQIGRRNYTIARHALSFVGEPKSYT